MSGKTKNRRQMAERYGRRSEMLALLALAVKGFRPVARRVKTPGGEIDLIVRRGKVLAFVEVKARAKRDLALAAVNKRQSERIVVGARYWLARNDGYGAFDCRFDIVLVTPYQWPHHLTNAFGDGVW